MSYFFLWVNIPVIVDEQNGEFAVWEQWTAMFLTMANDGAGKRIELVGRDSFPEFSGQGKFSDINGNA